MQPAELMLFVFDSIQVSLHDDREQYRTTTKLVVQTYVNKETNSLCVGNAVNMQARTGHVALAAAGVIDTGS